MVEEAAAAPAAGTAEPGAADASAGAGAAGQEGAPAVDLTDYRLKVGNGSHRHTYECDIKIFRQEKLKCVI